jgi:primosomal protein N' (replication factor Y)
VAESPQRGATPEDLDARTRLAAVAVPLPIPGPLTYEVPAAFRPLARRGARARVRVGKRRLTGVIVDLPQEPPDGVELKPLEGIVDPLPVLSGELLELANFVADYYLAPIGEVLATVLPSRLRPWGDQRVWLTDAGAIAPAASKEEARVIEALRGAGRLSMAELMARTGLGDLARIVDQLRDRGRVTVSEGQRSGSRYVGAVDLAPGSLEEHLEKAGRSRPGKEAVQFLHGLGRPATTDEICGEIGCTSGVVRRLVRLGILHQFTQVETLSLEHHRLAPRPAATFELRDDQQRALEPIEEAIRQGRSAAFLLRGLTGSGKTEVYLRAAEFALQHNLDVLLLVPEIALVPALGRDLRRRFGGRLAILHSGLGSAEREQEWERVRRGEATIVLGPRSAVFAPLANLGLVVVDEEQDAAYKQETTPRYHGRDVAWVRARSAGAVTVLVSATPSLESRLNAERGKLESVTLEQRVGQGEPAEGILVDMRQEPPMRPGEVAVSSRLKQEIVDTLDAGQQVILLRNRRGYAPVLLCRACGEDFRCPECGLPRTFHKASRRLLCHYCGSSLAAPERCSACGKDALEPIGSGTERVEEALREMFPGIGIATLDRDAVRRQGGLARVLQDFEQGATRILVGTQMVSKGHHFPQVALTAVLLADTYLSFPDFRAVERTYTLLMQLAGRAGRGEHPGRVVLQTYHPEHYAIQAVLQQDDERFAGEEMRFRRTFHYPPYTRMAQLLVRDRNQSKARRVLDDVAEAIDRHTLSRGVRITGPAPAPFERLRGHWRFQLLLRARSGRRLRELLRATLPERMPSELQVDIDPYQLL